MTDPRFFPESPASGKIPGAFSIISVVIPIAIADTLTELKTTERGFPVIGIRVTTILPILAIAIAWATPVRASEAQATAAASQTLPTVVVESTAIPGGAIDIDKIPGNVQVLSAADLAREGSTSLTNALNSNLSSVNINDNLDDPFQPDILYRGFEASPVLGTPQGLAVYQNGVRINEAFGDTVNWDLFPDIAINQVELVSSSPVYGLNALGGAISVTMKNGFTYQGADVELSGGSYGQHAVTAQYGVKAGLVGFYIAGKELNWTGWREFSEDRIRQLYSAFSVHTDRASIDLSYIWADNELNGQGSAPVQELAVNRSLVFTGPQNNINTLDFVTLNGGLKVSDSWSLQSVLYYRHYAQTVSNGNTTIYAACTNTPGILCQPDGVTPLTNSAGQTLPDISVGGTVTIGENDFESIQTWGRGATLQASDHESILGHDNQFTAGAAIDYAATTFFTAAQIGVINSQLIVLPSNLIVDTTEAGQNAALAAGNMNFSATPVSVYSVNKNLGIYLTDTFDVTPEIAVTASGRYNIANINLQDQLGTNLSGYNRFVHFNPAVGATYKAAPTVTLYGGISQNTRTPTASEIECSNPSTPCLLPTNLAGDPPNLRQVIARTSELGLRGKIADPIGAGSGLAWNLSLFRTLLHDDIFGIATSISQGFFQNIGDTRRQGVEAGVNYHDRNWSVYANFSFVQATFRSPLVVPSPSNPFQNAHGDLQVEPGDHLPGIPEQHLKLGADYSILPDWSVGATLTLVSSYYYVGDESNQLAPIPGYHVVGLHSSYKPVPHFELFGQITNLFNAKYSTWGILSDPTGIGAAGIPPNAVTNGPGVDNRFLSPAAPFEAFGGVRITF
jgi:iron complex outermembrane receptor protein